MSSGRAIDNAPTISELGIERGLCHRLFAYDGARSIKLDAAERRIHETTHRETIKHKHRAPSYFTFQPPPLRTTQEIDPIEFGRYRLSSSVDLVVYDFGAVEVIYTIPIGGPVKDLLNLSEELYDNEFLLADSRSRVEQLIRMMGDAVTKPHAPDIVEDYAIYHIESFTHPLNLNAFASENAQEIARILRAERQALSDEEVQDALATRISFGIEDLTIADWNAALVVDREGDDIRTVLEYANVELLEMRWLDQKLDLALNDAYETIARPSLNLPRMLGYYSADLRRLAELQVDNAILFEGVNNTLKLLGDQYLARVYALINKRFHLDEWDASILRKLQTLESIYGKISDQAGSRRLEMLEWVIILLIAFSVALQLAG
jgi:hypothetical protein